MADRRDDHPDGDISLKSLVERASSRPPPAGETRSGSSVPPSGVPAPGPTGASGTATPASRGDVPLDREPISAWGSPTLSSIRPPPEPSRAIPLAIVAGFGLLSAAVFAAILIVKYQQPDESPQPVAPVQPAVRTEADPSSVAVGGTAPEPTAAASPSDVGEVEDESEPPDEKERNDEVTTAIELSEARERALVPEAAKPIRAAVVIQPAGEEPAGDSAKEAAAPAAGSDRSSSAGSLTRSAKRRRKDQPTASAVSADAEKSETSAAAPLLEQPSREQTLSALKKVEERVKKCAAGQGGTATILIKVAGKTGAVQSVSVDGVEGSVGLCIAREVYRAKFPPFAKPVFTVRYPLAL